MTSESFLSVIKKENIFTSECNEDWNIISLNINWVIKIEKETSILTVHVDKITSAQLQYIEKNETKTIDLTEWQFEIYKIEERISPFQFFITDVDMDFKNKKLIASI